MSTTTSTYALVKHARGDTPWDVEVNADLDTIDAEIARPRIPFNSPTVGATTTCDLSLARAFAFTVSQVTTLAFTNVPSSSFFTRIWLKITNGGAFALSFPASVTWLGRVLPTFKTAGGDVVDLITTDAGTTWLATLRSSAATLLFTATAKSTTSTSDVSLTSYTLPANAFSAAGQMLRIRVTGNVSGLAGTVHLKWGSQDFFTQATTSTGLFMVDLMVSRAGLNSQAFEAIMWDATGAGSAPNGHAFGASSGLTQTETAAIVVDFRGQAGNAGNAFKYDSISVEYLAAF